ncbi:MAG: glycosyltransferase family 4 protein [Lewinellaceae bacterium]|nr:glycosyltransferase family 4 protein [Lewinellaceae bacterium]
MEIRPVHYILWEIGPGGMELGVRYYSEYFYRQRRLYTYGIRPTWKQIFDESKITIGSGDKGKVLPYWQYFRYVRQHRDGIFHLQNGGPVLLTLTLLAGVQRTIYHIHGTIYWKNAIQKIYLKAAWLLTRLLMLRGDVAFIANSHYSANIFRDKVMPVLPPVVYNCIDTQKFTALKTLRTQLRRIGYAGRLWNGKNVDLVIRLFEEIAGAYPDTELHIAGDGPLRPELEAQISKSPFAGRIKLLGYIQNIPEFYASMDLFLFLSAYESYGNVIAESILTGLPTLTSNVPVFEEIYGQEKDFILGDPAHYEQIKGNFLSIIRDFPSLARKAFALSESVEQQCNVENHMRQIESFYEKH